MAEQQNENGYPKLVCEKCSAQMDVIGVGSASGRLNYHCPKCGAKSWGKNLAAMQLGSLGGKARAESMTKKQRVEQASKAGRAGGKARAESMTPEQRSSQASVAGRVGGRIRAASLSKERQREISVAAKSVALKNYEIRAAKMKEIAIEEGELWMFNSDARIEREKYSRSLGTHTNTEWLSLVRFCGSKCLRCGCDNQRLTKDHIVPVYQGGSDSIDNLQPLCRPCNQSKSGDNIDFRPSGWRKAVGS